VNRDRLYLNHIIECLGKIQQYTVGGESVFFDDPKTQDAVLRNLHTLSESANQISVELQSAHPEVAWREIYAFRNVVVHNYLGLDEMIVWGIIVNDLPRLESDLRLILERLE